MTSRAPLIGSSPGAASAVVTSPQPSKGVKSMDNPRRRWGRQWTSTWASAMGSLVMMTFAPLVVWWFLWSCTDYDCSLVRSGRVLMHFGTHSPNAILSLFNPLRVIDLPSVLIWCSWLLAQFLLYSYIPGPLDHGQPTEAGYTLLYVVNGLRCWWISHLVLLALAFGVTGFSPALFITSNWLTFFHISNVAGWSLAILAYIKAHLAPSHARDNKFSGSYLYDLFMGIEHNPRLSSHPYSFDFKIFFNGRPGILAWTLINIMFTVTQYYNFGDISNGMWILNLLQATYVVDFFWNEGWYLRTIDIAHEHFGFYLAWGDLVWLPFMYTLQGLFLSTHYVQLSPLGSILVLSLGLGGYALFRVVNDEKDQFRKEMKRLNELAAATSKKRRRSIGETKSGMTYESSEEETEEEAFVFVGKTVQTQSGHIVNELSHYQLWGQATRYLTTSYHTTNSPLPQESYLLLSGCWSWSRHMNYLGDLMLSLAMCLTCGATHLLPYFYFFYMVTLLVHRTARDDEKCRAKYGPVWNTYCELVPYKIIPFVY